MLETRCNDRLFSPRDFSRPPSLRRSHTSGFSDYRRQVTSGRENNPFSLLNLSKRCVDFNKQVLFGEIGALVGTPLFPYVASRWTSDPDVISSFAVIGGLVTGSAFWLVVKVYDEKRRGAHSAWRLAGQIAWFTPAAFVVGLMTYQPTLFLVARWMIRGGAVLIVAVLTSQALAFGLFLGAMNIYRLAVHQIMGERM
jgi:hypothetical protein